MLYKGELCLLRVQYHSLLGHSQGVIQRRIMLTESSASLLTGTFPGLLNYRGGQIVLVNVFSFLGQAQVAILHRRYTRELPPYWIIPGFNCVNTKENTLMIHVVPTGTYPGYIYADQIGFGLQTFGV